MWKGAIPIAFLATFVAALQHWAIGVFFFVLGVSLYVARNRYGAAGNADDDKS